MYVIKFTDTWEKIIFNRGLTNCKLYNLTIIFRKRQMK